MGNYRIEIAIRITPCDDERTTTPVQNGDESFSYVLSPDQALTIDTCEQAMLATSSMAVRAALAQHFSALSQAEAEALAQVSDEMQVKPYRKKRKPGGSRSRPAR